MSTKDEYGSGVWWCGRGTLWYMRRISLGFTLIELMVVISLIGILSAIVYANLGSGNAKARDAQRQSDLRNLQNAIAMYKLDTGKYPPMGSDGNGDGFSSEGEDTDYIEGLVPKYIRKLPKDPRLAGHEGYSYTVDNAGIVYKLMARNTVETELVTHEHPFKSCDIRVGNTSGSLSNGSSDREVIGWCGRTAQSSNGLPSQCNASQAPFNRSYGAWAGFLPKLNDTCPNNNTNCVAETTAIICR